MLGTDSSTTLPATPWRVDPPPLEPAASRDGIADDETPPVGQVLVAAAAMAAAGAAAALGSGELDVAARASAMLMGPALGAMVLTAPALLAVHQFLGLHAPPERIVAALARALVAGGRVALGLVPVALFFAATSGLWALAMAGVVAVPAIVMAAVALVHLHGAEQSSAPPRSRFGLLVIGWATLTLAIGARLMLSVAGYVQQAVSP